MAFLKVGYENEDPIKLYYEDHGFGSPIVLIHGWPLSGRSWEKQIPALLQTGHRVITYDRRGFGQSSQPANGYEADTLASDLNALISHLDLHEITLVGFSMGGCEVARYLGKYGSERISKAVFVAAVTPFLLKTNDNPEGIDSSAFKAIRDCIVEDRAKFLHSFLKDFYSVGLFEQVSKEIIRMSWNIGIAASPIGSLKTVDTWIEDFRDDLKSIDIQVMVIHGSADKTVPAEASGKRMKQFVKNCEYREIMGAPHGLNWTHAEELNKLLLDFIDRTPTIHKSAEDAKIIQTADLNGP